MISPYFYLKYTHRHTITLSWRQGRTKGSIVTISQVSQIVTIGQQNCSCSKSGGGKAGDWYPLQLAGIIALNRTQILRPSRSSCSQMLNTCTSQAEYSQSYLTHDIDHVAHAHHTEAHAWGGHAGSDGLPLVQPWIVYLSHVDHLFLCLPSRHKDLLTQHCSSYNSIIVERHSITNT